ncbi:hypothetical protein [Saccharothrix sp. NRRL B-16314]|uniref:hypothetical protein n=1 Tax=Saccharothrix sp. NRRL B-16314 TaxID=1463825 RepID=UPI0012DF3310|nr:hypothetical protein [Saccharothrix sp. NRRL B-16314]
MTAVRTASFHTARACIARVRTARRIATSAARRTGAFGIGGGTVELADYPVLAHAQVLACTDHRAGGHSKVYRQSAWPAGLRRPLPEPARTPAPGRARSPGISWWRAEVLVATGHDEVETCHGSAREGLPPTLIRAGDDEYCRVA